MDSSKPIYRVRRGMFRKAILQKLISVPTFSDNKVDVYNRQNIWVDVPYNGAPPVLQAFPPEKGQPHD